VKKRENEEDDENENEDMPVNNLSMKSYIFLTWAAPLSLV